MFRNYIMLPSPAQALIHCEPIESVSLSLSLYIYIYIYINPNTRLRGRLSFNCNLDGDFT
jgi:hypothetical protein